MFGKTTLDLFGHTDVAFVWPRKGGAFNPKNTVPTVKHEGGRIMLWGYCSASGPGSLSLSSRFFAFESLYHFSLSTLSTKEAL